MLSTDYQRIAEAIEYLETIGITKVEEHNLTLRNRLYQRLSNIPKLKIVSPPAGPLSSPMVACRIPDTIERNSFVAVLLDKYKLSIRPTHKQWFNGIRFSCHIFNTTSEVDFAAEVLQRELKT